MLDREQFLGLRAGVEALDNRAVFEIPEILQGLISHHRSANLRFGRNAAAAQFESQMHNGN